MGSWIVMLEHGGALNFVVVDELTSTTRKGQDALGYSIYMAMAL